MYRSLKICPRDNAPATDFCVCENQSLYLCKSCLPKHQGDSHQTYSLDLYPLYIDLGKDRTELKRRFDKLSKIYAFIDLLTARSEAVKEESQNLMRKLTDCYMRWTEQLHLYESNYLSSLRREIDMLLKLPPPSFTLVAEVMVKQFEKLTEVKVDNFTTIPEKGKIEEILHHCENELNLPASNAEALPRRTMLELLNNMMLESNHPNISLQEGRNLLPQKPGNADSFQVAQNLPPSEQGVPQIRVRAPQNVQLHQQRPAIPDALQGQPNSLLVPNPVAPKFEPGLGFQAQIGMMAPRQETAVVQSAAGGIDAQSGENPITDDQSDPPTQLVPDFKPISPLDSKPGNTPIVDVSSRKRGLMGLAKKGGTFNPMISKVIGNAPQNQSPGAQVGSSGPGVSGRPMGALPFKQYPPDIGRPGPSSKLGRIPPEPQESGGDSGFPIQPDAIEAGRSGPQSAQIWQVQIPLNLSPADMMIPEVGKGAANSFFSPQQPGQRWTIQKPNFPQQGYHS